jgi:dienelactone hydrolase
MISRPTSLLLLALVLAVAANLSDAQSAQGFAQQELRIPMHDAGAQGLQALLIYPETPGTHPLIVLSHGSPRDGAQRHQMTPLEMYPQAMEFARRGWAVAVVMRRGYGTSGGDWTEDWGSCKRPRFLAAGEAARADLIAAIDYLSNLPQLDRHRIVAVGISAGGFATVALAAAPPPGLVTAISFAGGRGSNSPDNVCAEDALVDAFRAFGATARTPMLWVYAENDHFFGPALAQRLVTAFRQGGDQVQFVQAGPFGREGHTLFSTVGASVWTPIVDAYLQSRNLRLVDVPLAPPPISDLRAPRPLSGDGLVAWRTYLAAPVHKAFAVSPRGRYGWRTARGSVSEAEAAALANCGSPDCAIAAIDDGLFFR